MQPCWRERHTFVLKKEYKGNTRYIHSFIAADYRISVSLRVATLRTRARHCSQNNVRNQNQHHSLCCRQPGVRATRLAISEQLNNVDLDMDTI
jgi:hypothetical protein